MKKRLKFHFCTWLIVVFGIAMMASLSAGGNLPACAQEKEVLDIWFVGQGVDPFWAPVILGAEEAEKALNALAPPKVKVHYVAPTLNVLEEQIEMLYSTIAAKPDALATVVTTPEPFDVPLRKLIADGVPVIAYNVDDPRPEGERIPYLAYIGQSFYVSGQKAAKRMLQEGPLTRAVIGMCIPEETALRRRAQGIVDTLKEKGIPVDILNLTQDRSTAYSVFTAYLIKHPDTDAIFTTSTGGTEPAMDLLKDKGLIGKVKIGGYDCSTKTFKGIKEGSVAFTVDQQPFLQGYLTAQWLYLNLRYGLTPPPVIGTGQAIIDKSNVEEVEKLVEQGYR